MGRGERAALLGEDGDKAAGGRGLGAGAVAYMHSGFADPGIDEHGLLAERRAVSESLRLGSSEVVPASPAFSSLGSVVLSCLAVTVGTGNLWRFPRIVARNGSDDGALVFILCWMLFLWAWSIPLILCEYILGKTTKASCVEGFARLLGAEHRWKGGWFFITNFAISSYYSVILGWCYYYCIYFTFSDIPKFEAADGCVVSDSDSFEVWEALQDSFWPVLCHGLAAAASCAAVLWGVSSIEKVNNVAVPILFLLLLGSVGFSMSLGNAKRGVAYIFRPSWRQFSDPAVWIDALSQTSWDTGAASGLFFTYAAFMSRSTPAIKLGVLIPVANNVTSLLACVMIFGTVFSQFSSIGCSQRQIVDQLQTDGPANTGLTFVWMPILYGNVQGGRALLVLFFLCLCLAGTSSLVSFVEVQVHILEDEGIRRDIAALIVFFAMFLAGLASALDMSVLINQDLVWGYALILSGMIMAHSLYTFGVRKFRLTFMNDGPPGDWAVPRAWEPVIVVLIPALAMALLAWWLVDSIVEDGEWYNPLKVNSPVSCLMQWFVATCCLVALRECYRRGVLDPTPAWHVTSSRPRYESEAHRQQILAETSDI